MTNKEFLELMRKVKQYHLNSQLEFDENCNKCPLVKKFGKDINCKSLLKVYDSMEEEELGDE